MNRTRTAMARPDAGFVIIGVVMFVLALTILGISLFGLSSYEAQFLGATQHAHQAMYDAESGMEMAKAVLDAPPRRLDGARLVEGVNGVTYACAWQRRPGGVIDSTGAVNPDSQVTIQVVAQRLGAVRRVQARFRPGERQSYYKQLFTVADSVGHIVVNLTTTALPNVRFKPSLVGQVWQNGTDSTWIADLNWPGRPPLKLGGVPLPNVGAFIGAHSTADSVELDNLSEASAFIPLLGTGTRYYVGGPDLPPGDFWRRISPIRVKVQGTAIWMLPGGMRSDNQFKLEVVGGATATLVMVAPPCGLASPLDPETGLWFFGGMEASDSLNVILVSSGRVVLEFWGNGFATTPYVRRLSVFAKKLLLMSPGSPGNAMDLRYAGSLDAVIDNLVAQNALPNAIGPVTGGYAMVPGTWRDRWP